MATGPLPFVSRRPAAAPQIVVIPSGRFLMGSDVGRPDERPVREAEVHALRMALTPVTNLQYARFLATGRVSSPPWWNDPAFFSPEQPVVGVTWFEAMGYCEWLSRTAGGRFRLPTEIEWERAARGGLESAPTPWGEAVPVGEIPEGPLTGPWTVGRGIPNGYGLFDMGTIVHEWCLDWYRQDASVVVPDPVEPLPGPEDGRRASRGGSWRHRVRWSSPSARSSLPPGFRYADYGFRVVLELT
jgi:formylglycine-generating enzyme required for sulfatase activity